MPPKPLTKALVKTLVETWVVGWGVAPKTAERCGRGRAVWLGAMEPGGAPVVSKARRVEPLVRGAPSPLIPKRYLCGRGGEGVPPSTPTLEVTSIHLFEVLG